RAAARNVCGCHLGHALQKTSAGPRSPGNQAPLLFDRFAENSFCFGTESVAGFRPASAKARSRRDSRVLAAWTYSRAVVRGAERQAARTRKHCGLAERRVQNKPVLAVAFFRHGPFWRIAG